MSNARFSILQARAISDKRVSDAQFRTLAALGMYADKNGWCFPSLFRIGLDCGKSKQAAGRDVIALKKLGYVETYPQFDERGGRKVNKYRLIFDTPINVDDSTPSTPEVDTPSTPEVDTPSTPEVDTPSTPEVDVNAPYNDPINNRLSKKEIQQVNEKVDYMIANSNKIADREKSAIAAFEQALNIPANWNWYPAKPTEEKTWRDFRLYILKAFEHDSQCFTKYNTWRDVPYQKNTMSNLQIKRNPENFPTSWVAFLASSAMAEKQIDPSAQYRPRISA